MGLCDLRCYLASSKTPVGNFMLNPSYEAAHTSMSKQALDSEQVQQGLKSILLGPAMLYESLKALGEVVDARDA